MSDALCRKYRLSVIENPTGRGKNFGEYSAEKNGKPTYRGMVRADIDQAIAASVTQDEFFSFLEGIGYELKLYKQDGDWLESSPFKSLETSYEFLKTKGFMKTKESITSRISEFQCRR